MSGGKAVNAGIDYQQRVASWLMVLFYRGIDVSEYFMGFGPFVIDSIAFETDEPVDDIVLVDAQQARMLVQVKRTVSMSDAVDSELGKAFRQFVTAHGPKSEVVNDVYVLVLSSKASRPVTTTLREVLERLRANPAAFNPAKLTQKEAEVYETTRKLVDALTQEIHKIPGDSILRSLLARVYVTLVDMEAGTAGEKAALSLLAASGFKTPGLVWGRLISLALTLAKARASVALPFLTGNLAKYQSIDLSAPKEEDVEALLAPSLLEPDELPAGKDVVLATLEGGDETKLLILEFFRFEDDGQRRIQYLGEVMTTLGGARFRVIARFGSMIRLEKFLARNKSLATDKSVTVFPANEEAIAKVEEAPAVKAHRKKLLAALAANKHPANCLHCGLYAFNSKTYFVEIDVSEYPSALGSVHEKCLRPTDRILGEPEGEEEEQHLSVPDFDFVKWSKLLMRGQAVLSDMERIKKLGVPPIIGWNEDVRYDADFRYVLRFETTNGEGSYCYRRGKIERFNKPTAAEKVAQFHAVKEAAIKRGDPLALNLDTLAFGGRSYLEKTKEPNEKIDDLKAISVVEYSELLGRIYNRFDNFYTPCCILRDEETEQPITVGGSLPLISRPLEIEAFVSNWKENGFEVGSYKLSIIENDMVFDQWMRQAFSDELTPVYDPRLTGNQVTEGIRIVPHAAMKALAEDEDGKIGEPPASS